MINTLELARQLIKCESITPKDAGAIDVLINVLEPLGFVCRKLEFGEVTNLYAKFGKEGANFCYAGHTDVVAPGDLKLWTSDPFTASIRNDRLYGRGAVDMKVAICCFIGAVSQFLHSKKSNFNGSLSLLITGDEEGDAENGTIKVLEWLKQKGEKIDHCLVGEPTNPEVLGEVIKIGRRGSISFNLTVQGTQGHVAYPNLADNPITTLINILSSLKKHQLDDGNEFFQASNLEITSIDVGNKTGNVIPAEAKCAFNIRFNTHHTSESLVEWITAVCNKYSDKYELKHRCSANAFITKPSRFTEVISSAVSEVTGINPVLNTDGGTSDARFIKDYCPVAEFGLINKTAHKIDEYVELKDIDKLEAIYLKILENYFNTSI